MSNNLPLPPVPRVNSADLRAFLAGIRARVSSLLGENGNGHERALTLQDLVDMGIITKTQAEKQAKKQ